jgi:methionyl-tRNA formyltransferase
MSEKILFLTNNPGSKHLFDWLAKTNEVKKWSEPLTTHILEQLNPSVVISYSYQHIIKSDVLSWPVRFINLHISYLPFNRGADPNAWSILDGTPSGVSIHLIDSGIDTGPILVQKLVDLADTETLASSYQRMQDEIQTLFQENWPELMNIEPKIQTSKGTFHNARDFAAIKEKLLGSEGWDVSLATLKKRATSA